MAIKTFILENSTTKKQRQSDIQKAVREFLKDNKVKIVYDENGIPSVENTEKKLYLSIARAEKVMLAVLCDKPVGTSQRDYCHPLPALPPALLFQHW